MLQAAMLAKNFITEYIFPQPLWQIPLLIVLIGLIIFWVRYRKRQM